MCGPAELDRVPALIDNELRTSVEERSTLDEAGQPARSAEGRTALQGGRGPGPIGRRTAGPADHGRGGRPRWSWSTSPAPSLPTTPPRTGSPRTSASRAAATSCVRTVWSRTPAARRSTARRTAIVEECKRSSPTPASIEVTLLGQTVNHYHFDDGRRREPSAGVVQPQTGTVISPNAGTGGPSARCSRKPPSASPTCCTASTRRCRPFRRLRFVTSYPRDFGDDILSVMRDSPRICRYLHLPVQSGSNRVLARR